MSGVSFIGFVFWTLLAPTAWRRLRSEPAGLGSDAPDNLLTLRGQDTARLARCEAQVTRTQQEASWLAWDTDQLGAVEPEVMGPSS